MDFIDFMIAKLIVVGIGAFVWGIYCGATNRTLDGRKERDWLNTDTTEDR